MNMNEVKKLMDEVGWATLATTNGAKVAARPMAGWAWMNGELWCATGASTEKIAHLDQVPHASYCFCAGDGRHARIAGSCTVSSDQDDKQKLYDANPILKDHIKDPASPDYVVIRMRPERILLMNTADMTYWEISPE